jgi:hypothetical protein
MKKFIAVAGVPLAVVREIDGLGINQLETFADGRADHDSQIIRCAKKGSWVWLSRTGQYAACRTDGSMPRR